jgi:hypothetical protein
MSDLYNKIHFENYEETSLVIHKYLKFPDEPFYEIINKIDAHIKGSYTAFPYNNN